MVYDKLGAREINHTGEVEFLLFIPDNAKDPRQYAGTADPKIATIRVVGTFQEQLGGANWDPASGLLMSVVAAPPPDLAARGVVYRATTGKALVSHFYEYKYYVTFADATVAPRYVPDPCSRYGGTENDNSAIAVGGKQVGKIKGLGNAQRVAPKDLVIYEMMLDDFTAEYRGTRAPFDAAVDKLDAIKAMGFNAVEPMPWMQWVGHDFSWGYTPAAYFAVAYRYMNDAKASADKLYHLKRFIEECHKRGLQVIMDGVFNHGDAPAPGLGFGYYWLYQNPDDCPYVGNFAGGGYARDLNYANDCVYEFVLDVCRYWIDTFKIDGIRFDYTLGFYKPDDSQHGLQRLLTGIKAHLQAGGIQNFALILEHLSDNRYDAIGVVNKVGATGCWYERMRELGQAALTSPLSVDLVRCANAAESCAPGTATVNYIESHDYTTLAWYAARRQEWWRTQPMAIVLATSPGGVMVHNGQEFAEEYWFPDPVAPGRVMPRPLRWSTNGSDGIGNAVRGVYTQLLHLRHDVPVLRAPGVWPRWQDTWARKPDGDGYGVDLDQGTFVCRRFDGPANAPTSLAVVAVNFSASPRVAWVNLPGPGTWKDGLNPGDGYQTASGWVGVPLPPYWGRVLVRGA
jgi:pullulanase